MRNAHALIMKRKLNNASTERVEGEDNNGQTTEIALKVIPDKKVMDKQRKIEGACAERVEGQDNNT